MRNKEINNIGVVGAGTMGAAIAQHFIMKGLEVVVVDIKQESLERGQGLIESSLQEALDKKVIREDQKKEMEGRLCLSTDFSSLKACDLVVEAVFEDIKVKKTVFEKVEQVVGEDCILATNTSSFSVSDLAEGLNFPERFVGVHYFFHAAKNKLVEIIPGKKTDQKILSRLMGFYSFYDKLPIEVNDVAGFAVNRFFVPWLNEAARLYEEGLGSPQLIDKVAMNTFKIGMGPFALMNATGVPIAHHAADGLAEKFGPFYGAAKVLVKQSQLGQPWEITDQVYKGDSSIQSQVVDDQGAVEIENRLLASALGVAAQMVSEGVATPTATDMAARVGLRWVAGPFEMINALGVERTIDVVTGLFSTWDLPIPSLLEESVSKKSIPIEYVRGYKDGDTGFVEFNRPDAMNALNEGTMNQLSEAFDFLDKDSEVKKIVFYGVGKAFVAGADIKFFVDNIEAKNVDRIYDFTHFGQEVLKKIESSSKITVAYLDGLTLGGGLEVALACNHRLGTSKTILGFPETGIGIYPGLGGTQRASRLIGKGLAKYLVATGKILSGDAAEAYGLVDQVIPRVRNMNELSQVDLAQGTDKPKGDRPEAEFFDFNGQRDSELFLKYEKQLKYKAPLALQKSMELVDQGFEMPLKEGLQLELDSLKWIFSTEDAYAGLSSIIKKQRPKYLGK